MEENNVGSEDGDMVDNAVSEDTSEGINELDGSEDEEMVENKVGSEDGEMVDDAV